MRQKFNWPLIISALILASGLIFISSSQKPSLNVSQPLSVKLKTPSLKENISVLPTIPPAPSQEDQTLKEIEILGQPNAKIFMEVYCDYQCPFCLRYYMDDIKPLIEEYVKTGKVKLVYRDLAMEGDKSEWAAQAAHCANDQSKFWEYHDKLYLERQEKGVEVYEKESLKQLAKEIGLNPAVFNNCFDSGKYVQTIKQALQEASDKKINGTPTTYLNGEPITNEKGELLGAMPYEMLKARIDALLNK